MKYHTGSFLYITFKRIFPASNEDTDGYWRKSTENREGSQCRNYYASFGTILKLVTVFIEASRNLLFIVLFNNAA
jgi:hypothetical protein